MLFNRSLQSKIKLSILTVAALTVSPLVTASAQSEDTSRGDLPEPAAAPLQGSVEHFTVADDERLQAALAKRQSGAVLTSEDIRDLQIGVVGSEMFRRPGASYAIIEGLLPGFPTARAGLRVGDLVVGGDSSILQTHVDPTKQTYAFTGGRAGSTVTFRIVRNGEIKEIKVVRMNIEDIPDKKVRVTYENMARLLGPEGEGTVMVSDKMAKRSGFSDLSKGSPLGAVSETDDLKDDSEPSAAVPLQP